MCRLLHRYSSVLCDCQIVGATQLLTTFPEESKTILSQLQDVYGEIFGTSSPEYEVSKLFIYIDE
jgi:hypothetical protein